MSNGDIMMKQLDMMEDMMKTSFMREYLIGERIWKSFYEAEKKLKAKGADKECIDILREATKGIYFICHWSHGEYWEDNLEAERMDAWGKAESQLEEEYGLAVNGATGRDLIALWKEREEKLARWYGLKEEE